MHDSSDKSGEAGNSSYWRWVIGFLVLPALVVVAMVGTVTVLRASLALSPNADLNVLGYNIHPPFIGYVDGRHPRKLLEETEADQRSLTASPASSP